jgi:hypothetical protein
MSTSATLDSSSLRLDPGAEAVVPLHIRNNGDIVEGYRMEVVGAPGAWATVEPDTVSLYPGTSTTARVAFRPPRSAAVPAGELQFGVVVTPTEHPEDAVVPEGVIEVLPFYETTAELVPHTSQGRRRGRHKVAVDNRGNVPVTVVLDAADQAKLVSFKLKPPGMTVPAGTAAFADVGVKPEDTLWRGTPITHPFTVTVSPQDGQPVALDGTYLQQPMLPPWALKALLALLALLAALAALWFLVLKPTVESAAKEAVEEPVAQAQEEAAAAQQEAAAAEEQAQQASEAAGSAQLSAGDAQKSADSAAGSAGVARRTRTVVVPVSRRLEIADAPGGGTSSESFTLPERTQLALTDLVLSNPQGDFGRVELALDDNTLFNLALENFRDIDYHFVSPIRARAGQELTLTLQCNEVGVPPGQTPPPTECSVALYFGGEMTRPVRRPG